MVIGFAGICLSDGTEQGPLEIISNPRVCKCTNVVAEGGVHGGKTKGWEKPGDGNKQQRH